MKAAAMLADLISRQEIFSIESVCAQMGVTDQKDRQYVAVRLSAMMLQGRICRVCHGVYCQAGARTRRPVPDAWEGACAARMLADPSSVTFLTRHAAAEVLWDVPADTTMPILVMADGRFAPFRFQDRTIRRCRGPYDASFVAKVEGANIWATTAERTFVDLVCQWPADETWSRLTSSLVLARNLDGNKLVQVLSQGRTDLDAAKVGYFAQAIAFRIKDSPTLLHECRRRAANVQPGTALMKNHCRPEAMRCVRQPMWNLLAPTDPYGDPRSMA